MLKGEENWLSLVHGALSEDMERRGCFEPGKAAAFCAVPVLGPSLWLLLRPPLDE